MSDLRSLAETAAFFRVSLPTMRRWIDKGCPVAEKGSNGVAYKFDLREVSAWKADEEAREEAETAAKAERDQQLRLELLGGEALTAQDDGAFSPRQRADALAAEVSRTKLAQLRGELVPAEPLSLRLAEIFAEVKTAVRQIPDLVGAEMGWPRDDIERATALVDELLNAAADKVEGMLTDAAPDAG